MSEEIPKAVLVTPPSTANILDELIQREWDKIDDAFRLATMEENRIKMDIRGEYSRPFATKIAKRYSRGTTKLSVERVYTTYRPLSTGIEFRVEDESMCSLCLIM